MQSQRKLGVLFLCDIISPGCRVHGIESKCDFQHARTFKTANVFGRAHLSDLEQSTC